MGKNLPASTGDMGDRGSLGWDDPLEKEMATHSSGFLFGKFHGQRSLAG